MKNSERLKERLAILRTNILEDIKREVIRIQIVIAIANPDEDHPEGEIRLIDGVTFDTISSDFDKKIMGIMTGDQEIVNVLTDDGFEEVEEDLNFFSSVVLIQVLEELEAIQTIEDVEFIG